MTKEELIWVATVFDCEGCLHMQKQNYKKKNGEIRTYETPIALIGHCSLDLIARFHTLVGMGKLYGHNYDYSYRYKTERKQVYWWKVWGKGVAPFIDLIWDEWLSDYRRETAIKMGVAPMSRVTGAIRHTHRYQKTFPNLRRNEPIWKCTLPGCSHFIPHNCSVLGRKSICWECGSEFVMDESRLNEDMPKCFDCSLGPVAPIPEVKETREDEENVTEEEKLRREKSRKFLHDIMGPSRK